MRRLCIVLVFVIPSKIMDGEMGMCCSRYLKQKALYIFGKILQKFLDILKECDKINITIRDSEIGKIGM